MADAFTVTVLTGAGVSADSGVPTFRGPDGLWNNFRAEDLATPEAFARDPQLVWEWNKTGAEVSLPLHDRMPLTMRWLDWNGDSINAGAASGSSRKMSTVCTCRPDRAG